MIFNANTFCGARFASPNAARLNAKRGFTLIELLVAISVLAVVAVLGWRGLDGIVRARINLTQQLEKTRGMQLAFAQLQSDCAHMVNSAAVPDRMILIYDGGRLSMVRTVFADDQPMRLQVVSYRLKDGVLTRRESDVTRDLNQLDMLWMAATNDADAKQEVVLQTDVGAMAIRVWISDGNGWRDLKAFTSQTVRSTAGQVAQPATIGPTGLEVSLQLQGSDVNLTKVFLLGPV